MKLKIASTGLLTDSSRSDLDGEFLVSRRGLSQPPLCCPLQRQGQLVFWDVAIEQSALAIRASSEPHWPTRASSRACGSYSAYRSDL